MTTLPEPPALSQDDVLLVVGFRDRGEAIAVYDEIKGLARSVRPTMRVILLRGTTRLSSLGRPHAVSVASAGSALDGLRSWAVRIDLQNYSEEGVWTQVSSGEFRRSSTVQEWVDLGP